MKKLAFVCLWSIFIYCTNSCKKKETADIHIKNLNTYIKDTQTLRNIKEVLWAKAYREQDTVLLDQILDKSFEFIDGSGNRTSKTDELNWIKNNVMTHDSFRYEIKRLEVYDNGTAIISGTGHIQNDTIFYKYESSNVLIKKDTLWKAISSHVSGYRKVEE